MRVSNSDTNQVQGTQPGRTHAAKGAKETKEVKDVKDSKAASRASESSVTDGANTEISAKAKEFARAKEVASSAPDVREEKIAELKRRISAGKYQIDADAVADRMVDDHLKMSGMS